MSEYDELCRVVLTGAARTGKSSLMNSYVGDSFNESYMATIGVDFKIGGIVEVGGRMCKLQIWDTAGQTRFETITSSYYRGANIMMLVYAIDDRQSFQQIEYYYQRCQQYANNPIYVLVGNKSDRERNVTFDEATQYAASHDMIFGQVSALTSPQAFRTLVRQGLQRWVTTLREKLPRQRVYTDPRPPEMLEARKIDWWQYAPIFILALVLILIAAQAI